MMAKDKGICSVDGCRKPVHCRSLCGMHYRRQWEHGDVNVTLIKSPGTLLAWCDAHADYSEDDCLIWPFAREAKGYGLITVKGKTYNASRYLCILSKGEPPEPQMDAAHICGNGHLGCVNPSHLYWASKKQNSADRIRHGTNGMKLTPDEVRGIRARFESGDRAVDIANDYGVSWSLVYQIGRRKVWRGIK